jgi:anaerobic magnesium-protoporphyrin IX monomethyl ester cyclase
LTSSAAGPSDLERRATLAYSVGRYTESAALWSACLAAHKAERSQPPPSTWAGLGHCCLALGDHAAAEQAYRTALVAAERLRDIRAEIAARTGLGYLHQARGAFAEAARAFADAAGLVDRAGDALGAAWTRVAEGSAHYLGGAHREALHAYRAALVVIRAGASPVDRAGALTNYGGILVAANEHPAAHAALEDAAEALPAEASGTPLEARLRHNRGLAAMALGRFDEAAADLGTAADLFGALGDPAREAESLASRSDLHRYRGDLGAAIADHQRVIALEQAHGFSVEEPGGLRYSLIEDRALHLDGDRQPPAASTEASVARAIGHRPELERRPFVIFAPPCPGSSGPLFPRGATALASFLIHRGVPTVVVPLSHYVDVFAGEDAVHARTAEVVRDAIDTLHPRAIGITATFSYLYPRAREMARLAREAAPDRPIVIGGPHVTYQDQECLAEAPEIDVVVRGEGEWTALELLRALESGRDLGEIRGITWRPSPGRIQRNQPRPLGDLLELPDVDFGLLPKTFAERMEVSGMTGRGCSFRCRYCHEFRFWGGAVRQHPVLRVVSEMERVARDHGNTMLGIDDSMLSMKDPYFGELCDRLGRSPWFVPDRFGLLTRVDTVTREGLAAMRRVNLCSVKVGLESGSDPVLRAMNKGVTVTQARECLDLARASGIAVGAFFIVGHPGDSPVESDRTLAWVDALLASNLIGCVDAAMFTPYPGTPFFAHPEKNGVRILTLDWSRWRRTNRPVAELAGYPASAIYLSDLRLLRAQAEARADEGV